MKPHNTLLKKIIILFISIFIPISIFSLTAVNRSNRKLKDQVLASIDSNNENYISQLNTALDSIHINSFNLINQTNIRDLSYASMALSPYSHSVQVKLLREQIAGLCLNSSLVESAHIYYQNNNIVYHSPGFRYGSFHHISEKEKAVLEKHIKEQRSLHYYLDPFTKQKTLAFLLSPINHLDYCASIVLSPDELRDYMNANSTYDGEHYLLVFDNDFVLTDLPSRMRNDSIALHEKLMKNTSGKHYIKVALGNEDYYVFSYAMKDTSAYYMRLIPAKILLKHINTTPLLIVLFSALTLGACILFFIGIYHIVHQPLYQLATAFEEVENGNFKITIADHKNTDFAYLFQAFNNMTLRLDKLIERDYNQKMLLQKAELKQLQAQINPHFLYNSFFMLQRMIKMEMVEESQEVANALGIYFRYLTRNSMDNVTLAEEYEHAKNYAYIQGLRFAGRIQIHLEDIPAAFRHLPVPKLILQPLLENAFNYGLKNKIENGLLEVHFSGAEDTLVITVEDNGDELTDELLDSLKQKLHTVITDSKNYEMTGLFNIQRRLTIFSNFKNVLHVSRSGLGGLCVTILLQKKTSEVNENALTHCR